MFARRALTAYEKSLGPEHPYVAYPLINLGRIARQRKDDAQALEMYRRALTIREKAIGREDVDAAALMNNIANIYKTNGDYPKALAMYQQVFNIAEKSAGPYHVLTITVLGNIANLYRVEGDVANAVLYQRRLDERLEATLALNLAVGSERQKLAFFDSLAERTDRTISLHVNAAPEDQSACALATLVLLQRKGRVLDAMSSSLTALRQRFNPEDQKLLDQLNSITAQVAKIALSGPQNVSTDDYHLQLKSLQEQKEKLETQISNRSGEFRANSQPVTLAAVQAAVPKDAALIEFAVYRPFDPKLEGNQYGTPRYVAYIARQQGEVEWKELGEAQAIDAAVEELRQALRDPQRTDVRDLSRAVDEKVMQPLRALLGETTHLLISPDGELNLIPFEALVDENGRYLVQRYAVTYLTSGRDLLRMQVAKGGSGVPKVIANPLFGEPAGEPIAKVSANLNSSHNRRSVTTARDLSEVYFAPLAGTAQEGLTIQKFFPDADVLSGSQATESALKAIVAPPILHVATHGFFLQDAATSAVGSLKVATRGISANAKIENPLLRSGLALAGANLRSSVGEDGILTALEASGLNLWGTRLVVLSACDTGVGEVRNHEGVYGLRRAFVLAGAQSLVMSLWPVSDYATRTLMADYYRNLKLGMGRGAALRQVQLDTLKKNKQLHPFYWANFIESGEWANLDGRR
jgi:CHAT domain-containing protein